jgi:plastocyanin
MKCFNFILSVQVAVLVMLSSYNANATKWIVNVQNFTFSPSNLPSVNVGDTIRWVWINGSHTTTSTAIPGGAASWDHPLNSGNTFYEYPVTVAGGYDYHCTPHAGMGMVGSFTATALTPLLVSIDPNQAVQSNSFLATITGSNTNFNGSPAVSLSFSGNPGEIINAGSVTIVSPTVLHAQFTIPGSASVGLWDVNVNSLVLNNGFTVILAVPAIISISPGTGNQGAQFSATITGQYTGWSGTPSVSLSFSGDPGEIITGNNVVVQFSTHLTADFEIPFDASPGFYNVHVDSLLLTNGFEVIEVFPVILDIEPNSAYQGDSFNGTIIGQNTSWAGTPSVYLSYSGNPSEMITGTNVIVINTSELTADFSVPFDASTGFYNIHVDTLELEGGFTVNEVIPYIISIDPDSANQGDMLTTMVLAANSRFTLTEPAVYLSYSADPFEVINASNVTVISDTQLDVVFNIPVDASIGEWDLHVGSMVLAQGFKIKLMTGINDALAASIQTYPNPAGTWFFIENANGADVSVFNTKGENILSEKIQSGKQAIDISQFSHGIYIVRIRIDGNDRIEKLLKN